MGTFRESIIAYFSVKVRRRIVYLIFQHYAQVDAKILAELYKRQVNVSPASRFLS